MSSQSYSSNLGATVNVDFVLNKLCNINLSLSFNLFAKGTKALNLYQIYMLYNKKKKKILDHFFSRQTTKVSHCPAVCKSPLFL